MAEVGTRTIGGLTVSRDHFGNVSFVTTGSTDPTLNAREAEELAEFLETSSADAKAALKEQRANEKAALEKLIADEPGDEADVVVHDDGSGRVGHSIDEVEDPAKAAAARKARKARKREDKAARKAAAASTAEKVRAVGSLEPGEGTFQSDISKVPQPNRARVTIADNPQPRSTDEKDEPGSTPGSSAPARSSSGTQRSGVSTSTETKADKS